MFFEKLNRKRRWRGIFLVMGGVVLWIMIYEASRIFPKHSKLGAMLLLSGGAVLVLLGLVIIGRANLLRRQFMEASGRIKKRSDHRSLKILHP